MQPDAPASEPYSQHQASHTHLPGEEREEASCLRAEWAATWMEIGQSCTSRGCHLPAAPSQSPQDPSKPPGSEASG